MSDPVRKVSKKKILFVDLEEEIPHVFERISVLPYKEIYLVVPQRAALLQSVINLKILKQKLIEINKELNLVTSDPVGMKLAHQAEIRVYDQWSVDQELETPVPSENPESPSTLLTPIAASTNDIQETLPSRLPQKKSSIFEVVRRVRKSDGHNSFYQWIQNLKNRQLPFSKENFVLPFPTNRRFLTGLLGASVAIFLLIAYVALPGATISIEPASSVVRKSINVVLSTSAKGENELQSYPLETDVKTSITYKASGSKSEGFRSSGKLTIVNKTAAARPLVAQTRFQTTDGLVFRLQSDATVPAGSANNPAKLEVAVMADDKDASGVTIGARGNIGPSSFFLPGLSESTRTQVYAESYAAMTGGDNNVTPLILEEDLIAAREQLEKELKDKALASLRKEAIAMGQDSKINLKLLEATELLEFTEPSIDIPYEMVGQELPSFEISGNIRASGLAYDAETLLALLKTVIKSVETPGKRLIRIDEDSISIEIVNIPGQSEGPIKFTANIQGVEEYEIASDLEGGRLFTKKIKEHIGGKTVEEAQSYLQNLPEVNRVEIKMWPRWSPAIPSLPENIKIKSLSEAKQVE
jgi:hypothetical protein